MPIDLSSALALATACAPDVAPQTLLSIVSVESGFDPLIIGVNGAQPRAIKSATRADAVRTARALIANGVSIDLGLTQINSKNLPWLGLDLDAVFDPCQNLGASARILAENYRRSQPVAGEEQTALRIALSLYNTGDRQRGLRNGYVTKVIGAATRLVPAIAVAAPAQILPPALDAPLATTAAPAAGPAAWDVFARAQVRDASFVFSPAPSSGAAP